MINNIYIYIYIHTYRHTDIQTYIHTDIHTDIYSLSDYETGTAVVVMGAFSWGAREVFVCCCCFRLFLFYLKLLLYKSFLSVQNTPF